MSDALIIVYGGGDKEGPAFERCCPQCGRFLKFPQRMLWHENAEGMCKFHPVTCSRCGDVEPEHVGWSGDFE